MLHKFINRSRVKVSYCTMTNMKQNISRHNAKILRTPNNDTELNTCNCQKKHECPLNGECLQSNLVYKADVKSLHYNTVKTYYGLTEQTFKARWYNHNFALNHEDHPQKTALSSYYWKCMKHWFPPKVLPEVTWSVKTKAYALSSGGRVCDLCLTEKLTILMADPKTTLNKRDEIMSKCLHK